MTIYLIICVYFTDIYWIHTSCWSYHVPMDLDGSYQFRQWQCPMQIDAETICCVGVDRPHLSCKGRDFIKPNLHGPKFAWKSDAIIHLLHQYPQVMFVSELGHLKKSVYFVRCLPSFWNQETSCIACVILFRLLVGLLCLILMLIGGGGDLFLHPETHYSFVDVLL